MKIEKIITMNHYKSFSNFSWSKFCKNASGQEEILQTFSIIFGENGSGKSAICDVLKSVSQTQDFQNITPTLAEVEINNGSNNKVYKYEGGKWTGQVDKNTFLFFDVDFVNANVHTHGVRSSNLQQGAHTQKAGKLIIDLDEHANTLKEVVMTKKEELDVLEKSCSDILNQKFSEEDQKCFESYENVDETNKKDIIIKTQEELKKLETARVSLQKISKQYAEISKISGVESIVFESSLLPKNIFTELFERKIKEKAQDKADAKIKEHFEKHKQFIEFAKDRIPQDYKDENCPLCMQPLANASKVIEYYRTVFDQTYENAKRQFLSDIQTAKSKLESLKSNLGSLPAKVITIFDALEKIKTDFEIQNIYNLEEKAELVKKFNNVFISEIDELLVALESLKNIDRKQINIANIYDMIEKRLEEIRKAVDNLNDLISAKNKSIADFKSKYSDQNKIANEIQEKNQKLTELTGLVNFLTSEKVKLIKVKKNLSQNRKN